MPIKRLKGEKAKAQAKGETSGTGPGTPKPKSNPNPPKIPFKEPEPVRLDQPPPTEVPPIRQVSDMPNSVVDKEAVYLLGLLDYKVKHAIADRDLKMVQIDTQLRNLQLKKQNTARECDAAIHKAKTQFGIHRHVIEEKYGLNLEFYNYDDMTGELVKT